MKQNNKTQISQYVIRYFKCQFSKGFKRSKIPGQGVMRAGEGAITAGQSF